MRLKLTLQRPGAGAVDLVTDVDGTVTVGALALAVARSEPSGGLKAVAEQGRVTLAVARVAGQWSPLDPGLSLAESDLGSGQHVQLVAAGKTGGSGATLSVLAGPDAGRRFDLVRGVNTVGRDRSAQVRLTDPMVSQRHAKVLVGETVEIVDDSSTNGILVGADQVQRMVLRPDDQVVLGDSVISVSAREGGAKAGTTVTSSGTIAFNRSPRVDPTFVGSELTAPEPPTPAQPQRFPLITAIVPLLMGGVLYAITRSVFSIVFVALSPMMVVGAYWENRRAARRSLEEGTRLFRQNLAQLVAELGQEQERERAGRCAEHPSTAEMVDAVRDLSPLLWTRRPEHASFLALRMGLGRQPSRTTVEVSSQRNGPVELQQELRATVDPYLEIDEVPIVARLDESGSLGISGPDELRSGIARSLVAQLVALHSPAEVVLCGLASPRSAAAWDWLKWLPHVGGDHSPIEAAPLATTAPTCGSLALELADLVATRAETADVQRSGPVLPAVVVVVEDDAPVDRAALVRIMETGREHGVHVIWVAPTTARVPAAARTFLEVDPAMGAATGKVIEAERVTSVVVEPLDGTGAEWLGRRLSPVVDAGIQADTASDVPTSVSFVREAGLDLISDPAAVVERWRESNTLWSADQPRRRLKRDNTLRALVGRSALDPLHLDLRAQGPHALVGGTTGAGKSEFLQTWILAMAAAHSPQRVTFLFVDYKGGAAFADCTHLPHAVGLVTDLSPHLVQRALTSLNAELRHREHILNRKKAKDLLELERRGDPDAPPSLVIVVDEFAALVQEVPEFVDGVVNVAQRGRSLGLHLILATQRPAGVIKDNLRANTNLRVALRMADEEDSKDVVGTALAGTFDPAVPGRAIVKTGPGRLTLFQSGYVGGWTSDVPAPPTVRLVTLGFGTAEEWEVADDARPDEPEADPGPPDIQRLVANLQAAATQAGVDRPRRPWLPDLAHVYDLSALPNARRDSELVFGVVDRPEAQAQEEVAFRPDEEGNMAVFGTGGSGKTTFLRTLAVSAGFTARSGPCFVYGLDFGSRGLKVLEALPHVGSIIGADDIERTMRLMAQLRAMVDERALQFAAVNAGSVEEYRKLAAQPETPRVLLLVDGFAAFRTAYEPAVTNRVFEQLIGIAADGRPVGIHVVLSADRLGAVPATLASSIQRKLALRTASELDDGMLGVPKGGLPDGSPPGRGFLDGASIQVAVLGGTPDVATQAREVERLAAAMTRAGAVAAPPIERLPDSVDLHDLPVAVDGRPTFGLADDTLGPAGFDPAGPFLVAGPAGSGRSTTVLAMLTSLRRWRPETKVAYFGPRRSPLASHPWDRRAIGPAEAAKQAEELVGEWADTEVDGWAVVIDGLGDMLNSDADYPLQDLMKVCRSAGVFVVADGETSDVSGSWPLVAAIKSSRHGIILQPDQGDGETVFRTNLGRVQRAEFPEGRGVYVRQGRTRRIQVADARGAADPPPSGPPS